MPEEAWIGATPQRCAKAASEGSAGVVAGSDEQQGGREHTDTMQVEQRRGGRFDQLGELATEAGAVGVDVEHTSTEGLHRQLRGVHDGITSRVGAQRRGGLGETGDGDATEPFAQLIGCAEAEMTELVETLDAHVTARAVPNEQHPDRLDVAIGGLRHSVRPTRQRRSGSLHSVDAVGLAVGATGLTIGATDLDHCHAGAAQEAGQPGPIGAGSLHADPIEVAEAAQPGV